jgi:long-subunit acyl-CoA synthetase (AMP-forming)
MIENYFRAEWMLAAQGAFKQSIPVVTVYTNLGEEAVRHSLQVNLIMLLVELNSSNLIYLPVKNKFAN